jgi:hypothetical protein
LVFLARFTGFRFGGTHDVSGAVAAVGAAMALAYDADRVTRDVDATFLPHGIVLEEARNVAEAMGLPPWWLNDQASAYVSNQYDAGKREVFDHPGIRVMAASPEHVFAMKVFASQGRDEDDLRALAQRARRASRPTTRVEGGLAAAGSFPCASALVFGLLLRVHQGRGLSSCWEERFNGRGCLSVWDAPLRPG